MGKNYLLLSKSLYYYSFPYHCYVALPTHYSFVSSAALSILTFAAMQVFKEELATEGKMTILGGFMGSVFFIFFLTVSRTERSCMIEARWLVGFN